MRSAVWSKRGGVAAVVSLGLLGLGACGGGDGDSASNLTGDPIKIMATAPIESQTGSYPATIDAVKIYAEQINAEGGIDGRPLEVITCDNKFDPNATAKCARDAVSEEVVAAVGYVGPGVDQLVSILGDANIPWVAGSPSASSAEYTSETAFPVTIGPFAATGRALLVKKYECEDPALFLADLPQLALNVDITQKALAAEGLPEARLVQYPIDAADLAPYVSKLKGADCLIDSGNPSSVVAKLGPAIAQADLDLEHLIMTSGLSDTMIAQTPDVWDDRVTVVGFFQLPADGNPWEIYATNVDTYGSVDESKDTYFNGSAQGAFVAATLVGNVLTSLAEAGTTIDAAAVLEALSAASAASSSDLTPDLDLSQDSGVEGYPRLFNPNVAFYQVEDGKLVSDGSGDHDVLETINGSPSTDPFFAAP